jgi:hypothetical protein
MSNKAIGKAAGKTSNFCANIESVTFNSIRKVLPDRIILDACRQANYNHRNRFITPVLTVLHMILAGIWPEESFVASWQLLWASFAANFPSMAGQSPSRGTVSNARKRLPLEAWHKIVTWLSEKGQTYSEKFDKWRGHRVVAVDGTCMTVSNTKELCDSFGLSKGNTGSRIYPLVRMVCISIVETMVVINYRLGGYKTDENTLLKPMLKTLRKGDLLLADRHFAGSNLYWLYKENGLEYLTRKHQRLIVSRLKRLWSYGANDFVAKLKISDIYQRKNPEMPKYIKARFIQIETRIRGKYQRIWLVTSLLDADKYPANEIAELYLKRWSIEVLFRQFKIDLSADILRSKSSNAIYKEIAARICAINIVHTIMLETATANNIDVSRISFIHTVRAIIAFAPALAMQPAEQLPKIYRAMLCEIAAHLVPLRPGRLEPRKLAHDPKHYPRLKTTRAQWRDQYAA